MPTAHSKATAVWHGDLMKGSGEVSLASGVIKNQPVSWAARTEREGKNASQTSPEELIAGALAACFEMGLSNGLGGNGTPPEELSTTATATFEVGGGGVKISTIHLDLEGKVPGVSAAEFERFAQEAKSSCPVAGALKGNVEITLSAKLTN
ncbi:MAG: OsmC family peroxiredoxin [Nitrolancea sp.]